MLTESGDKRLELCFDIRQVESGVPRSTNRRAVGQVTATQQHPDPVVGPKLNLADTHPLAQLLKRGSCFSQLLVRDTLVHDLLGPGAEASYVRVLQAPHLAPSANHPEY